METWKGKKIIAIHQLKKKHIVKGYFKALNAVGPVKQTILSVKLVLFSYSSV